MTTRSDQSLSSRRQSPKWGFVVARTCYQEDPVADKQQWARASTKLRALAASGAEHRQTQAVPPSDFAMLVLDNQEQLAGVDYDGVRKVVQRQVPSYSQQDFDGDDDGDEEDETMAGGEKWPLGLRREGFLVVDGPSLSSLLEDEEPSTATAEVAKPHVAFVDATDPADLPYEGGSPFLGWIRARVVDLYDLADDLEHNPRVEQRIYEFYPHRDHPDQIPLYSISGGRLLEPDGGVGGDNERYRFPKGTPRGWQGCVAAWESIPIEYRGTQQLGQPPAWFVSQQQKETDEKQKEEARRQDESDLTA